MPSDPRPHSAKKPDGSEDKELETRLELLFRTVKGPSSKRPTDADSVLKFAQELWDRLGGK